MSSSTIEWDYIIVGAGSAGCALANRLTENPANRVLLIEAGGKPHLLSRLPVSYSLFIDKPGVNWRFFSEPEDATGGRRIPVPRGRMLGGSSSINGLVFVRGQPQDYDTWAELGNPGWSFDELLPLFKKLESYEGEITELRGADGPVKVGIAKDDSPIYEALFKAGEEIGVPRNTDYNSRNQEGLGLTQTTISGGRRMSAEHCYLKPARRRPNLTIHTGALAQRLILEGKLCVGIEYQRDGKLCSARASREVILAAGAINSPQLLELSGIGRADVLQKNGVELRHELPGVGENLRDHYAPRMALKIKQKKTTYNDRLKGLGLCGQVLRYLLTRKGFLSLPSAPLLGFLKTRPEMKLPDIQIHFVPYTVKNVQKRLLGDDPGITMTFYQLRPKSTGSIHIGSNDPAAYPVIRYNFMSAPEDQQCMIDGVRKIRELIQTQAMDAFRDDWIKPLKEIQTDNDILEWIKHTAETAYHPVGTCKMGVDPMAVVDPSLRVHGITGLRVADGSIMPTVTSGNTNSVCMMIGEKAAELLSAR